MAEGGVKFIRVRGRVVPIRDKGASAAKAPKKSGGKEKLRLTLRVKSTTVAGRFGAGFSAGAKPGAAIGGIVGALAGAQQAKNYKQLAINGIAGAAIGALGGAAQLGGFFGVANAALGNRKQIELGLSKAKPKNGK